MHTHPSLGKHAVILSSLASSADSLKFRHVEDTRVVIAKNFDRFDFGAHGISGTYIHC